MKYSRQVSLVFLYLFSYDDAQPFPSCRINAVLILCNSYFFNFLRKIMPIIIYLLMKVSWIGNR